MSQLTLESSTMHYAVTAPDPDGPDAWPDVRRRYTSLTFRPDVLSFDVHVTHEQHHVKVEDVRLSGFRVLKDGLSTHRIGEHYLTSDLPEFVKFYVTAARRRHLPPGTGQALPRAGAPERPEHRACRAS